MFTYQLVPMRDEKKKVVIWHLGLGILWEAMPLSISLLLWLISHLIVPGSVNDCSRSWSGNYANPQIVTLIKLYSMLLWDHQSPTKPVEANWLSLIFGDTPYTMSSFSYTKKKCSPPLPPLKNQCWCFFKDEACLARKIQLKSTLHRGKRARRVSWHW